MTWIQDLVAYSTSRLTERERDLLMGRGVSSEQMELYQLGHLNLELPEGLPEDFLRWAKNRIDDVYVLPLTTALGEIRGLQLRHVDRKNPGYQDYFLPEQHEPCLFGLGQAVKSMWDSRYVCLVEGAFDLFPIQRAIQPVVATLTARVSPSVARVLRRLVDSVFMAYDNDAPGIKGCKDFEEQYGPDFQVYVLPYPSVIGAKIKDPSDLWEVWGDAQLAPYIRTFINQQSQEM
jgi:DNA primase